MHRKSSRKVGIDNLPLFANSGRSWIRRGLQFRDERQGIDGVARHVPGPDAHLPDAPAVAEVQQVLAREVVQDFVEAAEAGGLYPVRR